MVGAVVLASDGSVVGQGFHGTWGGDHAEVGALAEAGERARGGTLVVTLEPCAHLDKKTKPCVPAVIAAGISRVVVGAKDPNPKTAGLAEQAFASVGIAYEVGQFADLCDGLLTRYSRHMGSDVPWTVAKWAMSADGRIADSGGHSRFITGPAARDIVHEIRAGVDAVIVGRGTVLERPDVAQ